MSVNGVRSSKRARWGMLIASLSLGVLLIGATASSWMAARGLSATVAQGQGDVFSKAIDVVMRSSVNKGPPSNEIFSDVLSAWHDQGLDYIGLYESSGELIVESGEPSESIAPTYFSTKEYESLIAVGDEFHLVRRIPGPEDGPKGGKGGKGGKEGKGGKGGKGSKAGPGGGGPVMILEFRASMARDLESRSTRNFGIGVAGALLLSIVSSVFWRMSVRAEFDAERMERQRTLATLGEMSAVLAHELRNPLASLKGHAQLLLERLPDGSKEHKKAQRVVDETLRIEGLTNDLLTFVRSGRVELTSVDPAELLWRSAEAVASERITLELDDAPTSWLLDAARMQQVLINLLQNALEVSPTDVPVEARVQSVPGGVQWSVRDRGPGIPAEDLGNIFKPFFTTKTRGTGLGLSVSNQIVEAHGGRIDVQNHPAGGAEFRVFVPGGE